MIVMKEKKWTIMQYKIALELQIFSSSPRNIDFKKTGSNKEEFRYIRIHSMSTYYTNYLLSEYKSICEILTIRDEIS